MSAGHAGVGVIVAVAGLPGVGKSTLARALGERVGGVVLDKDRIRAGLFPPPRVEYSSDQNDFCIDVLYRTAEWLIRRDPSLNIIVDGCTYTRAQQVTTLRRFAAELGVGLLIIECVCAADTALARLENDRLTGRHPAADRGPELYRALRGAADPITEPKLVVDTGQPVSTSVIECLRYLENA